MSRRNRSTTSISLFAFQDIITSVTGIMILMVLILTLELIERPQLSVSAESAEIDAGMKNTIQELERELQSTEENLQQSADKIQDASAYTPVSLKQETADARATNKALREENKKLREQERMLEKTETRTRTEYANTKAVRDRLAKTISQVEAAKRTLERETTDTRIIYTLPRGFSKDGWITVIGSETVAAAPLGKEAVPKVFKRGSPLAADRFINWAGTQQVDSTYFLLLVRPQGIEAFDSIDTRLTGMGFQFGFDLIGEDERILDSKRGAYW